MPLPPAWGERERCGQTGRWMYKIGDFEMWEWKKDTIEKHCWSTQEDLAGEFKWGRGIREDPEVLIAVMSLSKWAT